LHAAGFLAPPVRLALLAVLVGSVAVLAIATFGPEALREPGAGQPAEPWPDKSHRGNALPRLARAMRQPGAWLLALLIPFAAILWLLRTRTQLLGDGAVWLATVLSGERRAYSEPLSADSPYLAAAALALAVASHLSAVYLLPSYLVLVFLERRPLGRKLLEIAVPAALLVALLWALGYRPSDWIEPFRGATRGIRGG